MNTSRLQSVLWTLNNHPDGARLETLTALLGRDSGDLCETCSLLRQYGYAARIGYGVYQITDAGRQLLSSDAVELRLNGPPRRGETRSDLRQRIWRTLRLMRYDRPQTAPELMRLGSIDDRPQHRESASEYLRDLERVGIVRRCGRKYGGSAGARGFLLWHLDWPHAGPRAPTVSAKRAGVFDPNTGFFHAFPAKEARS